MALRSIADLKRSSRFVVSSCNVQQDRIGQRLDELLTPGLEPGESLPDVRKLVRLLGLSLQRASDLVSVTAARHDDELKDDAPHQTHRDGCFERLYASLVEFRRGLDGTFGAEWPAKFGFKGETPREHTLLVDQGREIARSIPTVRTPAPILGGPPVDLTPWAVRILAECDALEAALGAVDKEVQEADATLSDRRRAEAVFRPRYSRVATLVSALLAVAGEDELAGKVRPREYTRKGESEEDGEEEAAAEAVAGGGVAEEASQGEAADGGAEATG